MKEYPFAGYNHVHSRSDYAAAISIKVFKEDGYYADKAAMQRHFNLKYLKDPEGNLSSGISEAKKKGYIKEVDGYYIPLIFSIVSKKPRFRH
jgi:hypothetical protein